MSRWFIEIPQKKMCCPADVCARILASMRARLQTQRWLSSHSSDACSGCLTCAPVVVSQPAIWSASMAVNPRRVSSTAMEVFPDPGLPVIRNADGIGWFSLRAQRDPGVNADRNRSRNASVGHSGASGPGLRPFCHPQLEICLSTAGSLATIVIGTSRLAPPPVTIGAGWWSPRKTSTVFLVPYFSRNENRAVKEYWTERPYSVRMEVGLGHTSLRFLPALAMGAKSEPSPRSFHETIFGRGAQGVWLEVSSASTITGL